MTQSQSVQERFPFLTESDIEAITISHLESLAPGFQKFEMFKQLARLGGLDTVEIVPVRTSPEDEKSTEVLLARRPMDDQFWPGLLHIAGSVIREDDPIAHLHDWSPAISRAMAEMGGVRFMHDPVKADVVHRRGERSREVTIRYWVGVEGDTEHGEWHIAEGIQQHAEELGIFEDHAMFMRQAATAYEIDKSGRENPLAIQFADALARAPIQ
jgi:hypothetical protein